MRLQDKVAVVVGGGSDLATATGKKFISEGAAVILVHHNQASLDRVLPSYGDSSVETFIADVRNLDQLQETINTVEQRRGKIDVMVNCAGIINHKPIDELSSDDWLSVIDVNLTGAFNACKAVTLAMKAANSGRIINVASLGGRTGRPGVGVNYAASKAGMIGLTQTLARELAPWKITVNAVAPGPLKGRMFFGMDQDLIDQLQSNIPLGRIGKLDEVAGAILFLASEDAAWITGEVLDINGGLFI